LTKGDNSVWTKGDNFVIKNVYCFSAKPQFVPLDRKVVSAESLFAYFIAEHNLPFAIADHFTQLVPKMFPDSQVAGKFACSRTKTTQIIKRVLGPVLDRYVNKLAEYYRLFFSQIQILFFYRS
jgi:hypothetical protein